MWVLCSQLLHLEDIREVATVQVLNWYHVPDNCSAEERKIQKFNFGSYKEVSGCSKNFHLMENSCFMVCSMASFISYDFCLTTNSARDNNVIQIRP